MAENARILVVCAEQEQAENLAFSLQRQGLDAVGFSDPAKALEDIRRKPCDMILAESSVNGQSGLAFLTQARREAPLAQRIILEAANLPPETRALVNEIAPCAVFSGGVNADRVLELLALEGAVTHRVGAIFGPAGLEAERIEAENRNLTNQNRLLLKEFTNIQRERAKLLARLTKLEANPMKTTGAGSFSPASAVAAAATAPPVPEERIAEISRAIDRMLDEPDLVLPVVPVVGMKIRQLLSGETSSFETIAEMIKMESGMSARILHVANSPLYAGLERVRSLSQAMSRLGLRETRNLVQAIVAENLFKTKTPYMARIMIRLWMHSLCCAYANEQIARSLQVPESEDYFMMGLLHDIGKLVVIHLVEQGVARGESWAGQSLPEPVVHALMTRRHHELGRILVEKWNYPAVFSSVVSLHDDSEGLTKNGEAVVVTYYSNLLTRKLGYSLVPYEGDPLSDHRLAEALNVSHGMRLVLEDNIIQLVEKLKQTFFSGK